MHHFMRIASFRKFRFYTRFECTSKYSEVVEQPSKHENTKLIAIAFEIPVVSVTLFASKEHPLGIFSVKADAGFMMTTSN